MHLAALNLLGLVGTEHVRTTPCSNNLVWRCMHLSGTQDTTKQLFYYNVGLSACQAEFLMLDAYTTSGARLSKARHRGSIARGIHAAGIGGTP
ncbi:hypothetical protein SDC9_203513 [bioreactor metagenome]|uniref:Uncharacterized protein n=1 Tax=bioreactor metagenome TaxID=1076179 RepID=A0A645IZE0_9ZZZZ